MKSSPLQPSESRQSSRRLHGCDKSPKELAIDAANYRSLKSKIARQQGMVDFLHALDPQTELQPRLGMDRRKHLATRGHDVVAAADIFDDRLFFA
jgi:hypothetical protein